MSTNLSEIGSCKMIDIICANPRSCDLGCCPQVRDAEGKMKIFPRGKSRNLPQEMKRVRSARGRRVGVISHCGQACDFCCRFLCDLNNRKSGGVVAAGKEGRKEE